MISVRRPVDTPSGSLLPNVPPTPLNTTNIFPASNIQIEVNTSTPTVTKECRRIPNTQNEADISTPTATGESRRLPDTQIDVAITTRTAKVKRRRLPDTPVIPPTDYKQSSLMAIDRFLANPSSNTSKHNTYVIQYL